MCVFIGEAKAGGGCEGSGLRERVCERDNWLGSWAALFSFQF